MTAPAGPRQATRPRNRVDVAAVGLFLTVTLAAGWLVATPLWLSGRGLATPGAPFVLAAMMLTPSLGVLVVTVALRRGRPLAGPTGLRTPLRVWWRWALVAWLVPLPLSVLALVLAAAVGVYRPDLAHLSGFVDILGGRSGGVLPVSPWALVGAQLAQVLVVGWVNVLPALGEEWGWRGWLLPELLPLGRWPAFVVIGVVWGLWHAPALLLGYNYPLHSPGVRVLLMVAFCVVLSVVFGFLRLRSGSVWPAAIAHGFLNAVAGLPLLFAMAGQPVDNAATGLLGWTGWIVIALAFGLAVMMRGERARRPTRRTPDERRPVGYGDRTHRRADHRRAAGRAANRDFRDGHLLSGLPQRLLVVATGNITNARVARAARSAPRDGPPRAGRGRLRGAAA